MGNGDMDVRRRSRYSLQQPFIKSLT